MTNKVDKSITLKDKWHKAGYEDGIFDERNRLKSLIESKIGGLFTITGIGSHTVEPTYKKQDVKKAITEVFGND